MGDLTESINSAGHGQCPSLMLQPESSRGKRQWIRRHKREELLLAREQGYEAAVCFIIQMAEVRGFSPNDRTHPEFGAALRRAAERGVEVLALECAVEPGRLAVWRKLPVVLERGKVFPVSADI